VSVDIEDESKSDADDSEPRDVPEQVRNTKHALETSASQHASQSVDGAENAPTEAEFEGAAEIHQRHHLTPEQLAKTREQLEHKINTETVVEGKSKLPMIAGLLFVAAAGGAYLYSSSDTAPPDATGKVTADTAAVDENTAERLQHTIDERVGSAEIYRQQREALLEAQEEERKRLAAELEAQEKERERLAAELAAQKEQQVRIAAELEVKRKTEAARLAAELQVKRKAEQARLSVELEAAKRAERRRMQAELKAAKRKEKARLDAKLKAAKRVEQQRIQAELAAIKKAEEARLAAEIEAAINAEQERLEAEAARSQAVVAESEEFAEQDDAKFSANPCDGPTARFLSTCR